MKEFDLSRRTFLKLGAACGTGIVSAEVLYPLKRGINKAVKNITGYETGHVEANKLKEQFERCKTGSNPQECMQEIEKHIPAPIPFIVGDPIIEEAAFRAMPSYNLSRFEGRENPAADTIMGTGGVGMDRRELLVGATTSIIYGSAHNLTDTGFDTKTFPASQIFGGAVNWYLQRKLGFLANTFAHGWNNFKAFKAMKKSIKPYL